MLNTTPSLSSPTLGHPSSLRGPLLCSTLALAALLMACETVPDRNARLEDARTELAAARNDAQVQRHAAEEMRAASAALERADAARNAGAASADVDHLAYLASRRVDLARETGSARAAEAVVEGARTERDRLRLALRTAEADEAQRRLASAQQQGQAQAAALAQAGRDAASDRAALARGDARVDDLEAQLKALNARRTERGIVVTLGDMLFDSGKDRVLASGAASVSNLAEFMRRNPARRATVEGYTDSQGTDSANQALSERRAQAVRTMLVGMGIDGQRLSAMGHGEADPVASNDNAAGRRSNRRVEIVFAGEAGDLLRP